MRNETLPLFTPAPAADAPRRRLRTLARAALGRLCGLGPLADLYRRLPAADSPAAFAAAALRNLDVALNWDGPPPEALPAAGPLILAANHPFGALEGLALAACCRRVRPDLKILANHLLRGIPELRPMLIPVRVFGGNTAPAANAAGIKNALAHLRAGGALALFPAGAVSHWHWRGREVRDPAWNDLLGHLIRRTGAAVVPLFFEGRNSLLFQVAGCVHPLLRTLLLPRELLRLRGRTVTLRAGLPSESDLLPQLPSDTARTAHVRARCRALRRAEKPVARELPPVAPPKDRAALREAVAALPPQRLLAEDGPYRVLLFRGDESPAVLHEIGRLREATFRAVGEGGGTPLDLDRYDSRYEHLLLWNRQDQQLAGAYRIRSTDPEHPGGPADMYTASLFRFRPEFFRCCGPSLELGRAFITRAYQRDYAPLLLLWKGIGALAVRRGARSLFGPSSIGLGGYRPESVDMLRRHLLDRHHDAALAALVKGRRPPRGGAGPDVRGLDYKTVNRLVKDLEGDKGLPILFKHYLQMGGRIAAFHEDRAFGTLDALLVVDLAAAPEKLLLRYMGADGLRRLREAWTADA